MTVARVKLWDRTIGAVSIAESAQFADFEYDPEFQKSGIEVAPLMMPLSPPRIYSFPALARETFHGLPGLLSDSLPDRFGNALIDAWLSTQGRTPESFNAVERLCYIGKRGMGALEFEPAIGPSQKSTKLDVDALVNLASEILTKRERFTTSFALNQQQAMTDILRVGTSAGGARAKALIAWNETTNEVRSGQVKAGSGFSYWLLKFDGVTGNRDKDLDYPRGFGAIEYAYSRMAREAGIDMEDCRLFEENGRRHFMTKRFERRTDGDKIHMQTLCALAHFDFNQAGAYSYEQALQTIRRLDMPTAAIEEQFRRMVFNVVARNQDDHVKNIAFLMDRQGSWRLSPAFDLTFSYNPGGAWTNSHQMSLNGKRDSFVLEDFNAVAANAAIKKGRAREIVQQVSGAVRRWREFAGAAGVPDDQAAFIERNHRGGILQ